MNGVEFPDIQSISSVRKTEKFNQNVTVFMTHPQDHRVKM